MVDGSVDGSVENSVDSPVDGSVDLDGERAALERARRAVDAKIAKLKAIDGGGADELADEYIEFMVATTIDRLRHDLVVFGRIDDSEVWRVGLYGIDEGGEQLVVDWRAPFAAKFYQAAFEHPLGLERRVSYVGCIDDLFVEEFATGGVTGSSPLMAELSRSRGTAMRAAVATLQSEQDRLVRLDPEARLVLRGGPGTGKTVVGLHRAAWLVYNDRRITSDRILVIGPSDKFLRFVAAVLPTLGEARIAQTTFERLLGPSHPGVDTGDVLAALALLEEELYQPDGFVIDATRVREPEVTELIDRLRQRDLPWRERRQVFVQTLANRHHLPRGKVSTAVAKIFPPVSTKQTLAKVKRLGLVTDDGGVVDEVRAQVEGVPARYAHVIVDEAQDISELQLRAVMRRARGVTMVGDDAQRSNPDGIGLGVAAATLGVATEQMTTAYRMSAEIAAWLNGWARRHDIDAVELDGIRPTGRPVTEAPSAGLAGAEARLRGEWDNVAVIDHTDVWSHKGVEYDGVVVDTRGMPAAEVYLAASRAAHELVIVA
jgi:DNA helicase IV